MIMAMMMTVMIVDDSDDRDVHSPVRSMASLAGFTYHARTSMVVPTAERFSGLRWSLSLLVGELMIPSSFTSCPPCMFESSSSVSEQD